MLSAITTRSVRWLIAVSGVVVCAAQAQNFNQPSPAPANVAAKVVFLSGQVSVLRGSQPWALNLGDVVAPQQMVITGADGSAVFEVNDGSTFQVFPNSRVTFRSNYNWKDLVDLWIGRVKVHIQKWGGLPNPSRVHTPTAVISVRGTIFDVTHDADDSSLIAVEEGQVAVRHRLISQEKDNLINPGEQIRVYKNIPLAKARVDKGTMIRRGADAMAEAFYTIMMRGPRIGGGSSPVPGGGGAPLPGDTAGTPPPPPPPPGDPAGVPPPPPPND